MKKSYRIGMIGIICLTLGICIGSAIYAGAYNDTISFSVYGVEAELVNTQEFELDGIELIDISYSSQNVYFYPSDTDNCIIKEYLGNNKNKTDMKINGDTLSVHEKSSNQGFRFYVGGENEHIDIFLPRDYQESLQVTTSSGNIHIETEMDLQSLCVAASSGTITVEQVAAPMAVATTSGNIHMKEVVGGLAASSTSGNIDIECVELKQDIGLATTSGNIRLELPGESSFTYTGNATSGNIRTDFDDVLSFNDKGNEAKGSYNDGTDVTIQTETTSGNTKITLK